MSVPEAFLTNRIRALLPKVVERRDVLRTVAARYRSQYPESRVLAGGKRSEDTLRAIDALDPERASREDFDKAIGNKSWTELNCNICDRDSDVLVSIPREYDSPVAVCAECAAGVLEMLAKWGARDA